MYIKRRFKGNRYTKSVDTNDKALSNEQVDNFVSASYKKIKWSASDVANPSNINSKSPAIAATTDTEMSVTTTTASIFMLGSSFLFIHTLKDIINGVRIFPSCQSTKIIVNFDQTKKKGLSLPVTLYVLRVTGLQNIIIVKNLKVIPK